LQRCEEGDGSNAIAFFVFNCAALLQSSEEGPGRLLLVFFSFAALRCSAALQGSAMQHSVA
jgi:hypothetical protein